MRLSTLSSTRLIVVGAFLIFGGCLSIALGIPSATPINGSYPYGHLGYGIWGGLIYIIVGILNIVAAFKKNPELVMWCLVLNIVCCIIGVLQLALGISAANQDFNAMWLQKLNKSSDANDKALSIAYRDFYTQFFPMTLKIADFNKDLHNGIVAVDSLLAVAGFIVAIAAAIAAASLGRVVCCPELLTDFDSVAVVSAVHKDTNPKTVVQVTHENNAFETQA